MDLSSLVHECLRLGDLLIFEAAGNVDAMRTLRQQSHGSKCKMSALRQCLKKPGTWLVLFAVILMVIVADTFRLPEAQLTGWLYVQSVRLYQWGGRPLLKGRVQCRFQPTCSEYSVEAVEKHGIRSGLVLTYNRLSSCTCDVPLGRKDPVPNPEE